MADQTRGGISYCERTWNVTLGCSPVSAGCAACWANGMVRRIESAQHSDNPTVTVTGQWNGEICLRPDWLAKPLHWRKPLVILVQTLGDLFHEQVPFEFIAAVYGVMAACPQHTFLVLTKRPERMLEFHRWIDEQSPKGLPRLECNMRALQEEERQGSELLHRERCADPDGPWPLPNVWLGISAENQAELDRRVPLLLQVPAAHRWLSLEPLLGPLDLFAFMRGHIRDASLASLGVSSMPGIDWIAIGPETGPRARPCDVEWLRSVVRQCRDASVPAHVKAVPVDGKPSKNPHEWPDDLSVQDEVPHG